MPKTKKDQLPEIASIAALFVRCLAEKKLRLLDVAKKTGLGVATLSRFQRKVGKRGTSLTNLVRIENFLRDQGYLRKRGKAA